MKVIKGFSSNVKFTSNVKDVIHPIGELSSYSATYKKDRGLYSMDDDDIIFLETFTTTEYNKSSDSYEYVELNQDWLDHIYTIVNDVYKKVLAGDMSWTDEAARYLITTHQNIANSFKVGKIVRDGNFAVPGWIQWKRNGHESFIRIWFSDESFRRTYDEYEITVVPPIEVVDEFFKSRARVEEHVKNENDPVSMSMRVQKARNHQPETIFKSIIFDWHDRNDPTYRLPTRWDILIYGERGDNIDAIKDAIINHILEHSVHDQEEWKKIFPDIFKRTEFTIVPRWDNYAIPNRTIVEGIYSPIMRYNDMVDVIREYCHDKYGYSLTHINTYLTAMAHQYRSLQMLVVSHPENRDRKFLLTDHYPDYIAENTLTQDFNRQSLPTREFSEGLTEMIIEAEDFEEYSGVPIGMTRLNRNGKLFLVKSFNNIHFLVAAKSNFTKKP